MYFKLIKTLKLSDFNCLCDANHKQTIPDTKCKANVVKSIKCLKNNQTLNTSILTRFKMSLNKQLIVQKFMRFLITQLTHGFRSMKCLKSLSDLASQYREFLNRNFKCRFSEVFVGAFR